MSYKKPPTDSAWKSSDLSTTIGGDYPATHKKEDIMKVGDLIGNYMEAYEGTDIIVTAIDYPEVIYYNEEGEREDYGQVTHTLPPVVTFDLSDGTHWFEDFNFTSPTRESLVCETIGTDDEDYYRLGRNGHKYRIKWIDEWEEKEWVRKHIEKYLRTHKSQ